jgi:GTP-binding protein HflX
VVNDTLADIGAADKPILLVFNKMDQYRPDDAEADPFGEVKDAEDDGTHARPPLAQLQATYMAKLHDPVVFISAQERTNLEELRELLGKRVAALHQQRYPYQSATE